MGVDMCEPIGPRQGVNGIGAHYRRHLRLCVSGANDSCACVPIATRVFSGSCSLLERGMLLKVALLFFLTDIMCPRSAKTSSAHIFDSVLLYSFAMSHASLFLYRGSLEQRCVDIG